MEPTNGRSVHVTPLTRDSMHRHLLVSSTWAGEPSTRTEVSTHDVIPWYYKPSGQAWDNITLDREPVDLGEEAWVRDDLLTRLRPGGTLTVRPGPTTALAESDAPMGECPPELLRLKPVPKPPLGNPPQWIADLKRQAARIAELEQDKANLQHLLNLTAPDIYEVEENTITTPTPVEPDLTATAFATEMARLIANRPRTRRPRGI